MEPCGLGFRPALLAAGAAISGESLQYGLVSGLRMGGGTEETHYVRHRADCEPSDGHMLYFS